MRAKELLRLYDGMCPGLIPDDMRAFFIAVSDTYNRTPEWQRQVNLILFGIDAPDNDEKVMAAAGTCTTYWGRAREADAVLDDEATMRVANRLREEADAMTYEIDEDEYYAEQSKKAVAEDEKKMREVREKLDISLNSDPLRKIMSELEPVAKIAMDAMEHGEPGTPEEEKSIWDAAFPKHDPKNTVPPPKNTGKYDAIRGIKANEQHPGAQKRGMAAVVGKVVRVPLDRATPGFSRGRNGEGPGDNSDE